MHWRGNHSRQKCNISTIPTWSIQEYGTWFKEQTFASKEIKGKLNIDNEVKCDTECNNNMEMWPAKINDKVCEDLHEADQFLKHY